MKRTAFVLTTLAAVLLALPCQGGNGRKAGSAEKKFMNDNFAKGKISDEVMKEASAGSVALISCCMYYESVLEKTTAQGKKWVYTNSSKYAPQNVSFDHLVGGGRLGVNCALPASWAFVDMGILEEGMRFWGDRDGGFAKFDKVKDPIEKVAVINQMDGTKTFKELLAEGAVKAGDVFLCKGHTFIYLGGDLFFAAGHDGKWHTDTTAETEDRRNAVFESWVMPRESCIDNDYHIFWQISFKEDYIPDFYRNRKGRLVPNPILK